MSLADLPIEKLTGSINCSCGKTHTVITRLAAVSEDAPALLAEKLKGCPISGRILLICDRNTYRVLGSRAKDALENLAPVDVCTLRDGAHADEEAVGSALIAISQDTTRIVAAGSGTVNDVARYVASRVHVPYDVLGTAPSMDGYVSSVSPLIRRGFKITFEAVAPEYSLIDLSAAREAPLPMIAAGLGDVLGKYTALADWALAREVWGECYCEETAALMRRAVDTCAAAASGLAARDDKAVEALGQGLLLSGLAMQLVGNSRPASGAEHHMAHFWEITMLARGEKPTLHGDKVGFAALLILDYYKRFFERARPFATIDPGEWLSGIREAYGPIADEVIAASPPAEISANILYERALERWDALRAIADGITPLRSEVEALLRACGGPVTAGELGLSREDVRNALLYAMEIRPRPTVMRLGFAFGCHMNICEEIVEELYAK